MKLTNKQLRQIIKEELEIVLLEQKTSETNPSEILKQLKNDIANSDPGDELDNALVYHLFKQLNIKAGLDEQGRGFYIDFKNDVNAEIATKALFVLRKQDLDLGYKECASKWKGYMQTRMLFPGSREKLKKNLHCLHWDLELPEVSPYEKNMKED